MKENPVLITVIVPVYKVEKFLDDCVQSIIHQTYTNLEIILVDDGSPDKCPEMCDEYAKQDPRIQVVHKKNGGLSSARNAGLQVATGEYIGFVDSDDFIDNQMYEKIYRIIKENDNVGIVSAGIFSYENGIIKQYSQRWPANLNSVVNAKDFAYAIASESMSQIVCNKLYKADLVKHMRFKEGRLNEDTLFNYMLSESVELLNLKTINIPETLYYYRQSQTSITKGKSRVLCVKDMIENCNDIIKDSRVRGNEKVTNIIYRKYLSLLLSFNAGIICYPDLYDLYSSEYHSKLYNELSFNYVKQNWGLRHILAFLIIKYSPKLLLINPLFKFCFKNGLEPPF